MYFFHLALVCHPLILHTLSSYGKPFASSPCHLILTALLMVCFNTTTRITTKHRDTAWVSLPCSREIIPQVRSFVILIPVAHFRILWVFLSSDSSTYNLISVTPLFVPSKRQIPAQPMDSCPGSGSLSLSHRKPTRTRFKQLGPVFARNASSVEWPVHRLVNLVSWSCESFRSGILWTSSASL